MTDFTLFNTNETKYMTNGYIFCEKHLVVKYQFKNIEFDKFGSRIYATPYELSVTDIIEIGNKLGFEFIEEPYMIGSDRYWRVKKPISLWVEEHQIEKLKDLCKSLVIAERENKDAYEKELVEEKQKTKQAEEDETNRLKKARELGFKDTINCNSVVE